MFSLDSASIQRHLLDILKGCFTSSPFIIPHYVHKRHMVDVLRPCFIPSFFIPSLWWVSKRIVRILSKQAELLCGSPAVRANTRDVGNWGFRLSSARKDSNPTLPYFEKGSLYSGSTLRLCSHGSYFVSLTIFFFRWTHYEGQESFEYSVLYCIFLFSLSHGSSTLPQHSSGRWLERPSPKCGVCPLRHTWLQKPAFLP